MRSSLSIIGLALALLGAGIAGYLTFEYARGSSPICAFVQGCDVVAESAYARVAGIPTPAFGLGMCLVLAVLYGVRLLSPPPQQVERVFRAASLVLTIAGTGVSAWLTYVELYILHTICSWCLASAVTVTLLFAVAVADLLLTGKDAEKATESP